MGPVDETPPLEGWPMTAYARLRAVMKRVTNEIISEYQPDPTRLALFLVCHSRSSLFSFTCLSK